MAEATEETFVRPLDGVRVLDLSTYLAGPFAAKTLSDLGADVIKVEPPTGDPYRAVGPQRDDSGIYWANGNSGKRSVVIDLKTPEGLARLKRLLADADIMIENWRPSVAAKLGLPQEEVAREFPRLVRLSITGYGPDGPLVTEPVYDALIQGRTGLLAFEAADGVPRATNHFLADKVGAAYAGQMALVGLIARDKTGKGVHLQSSMLDILSFYNFPDMMQHRTYVDDTRDWTIPPQVVVPTRDGHIVVSPVTGKQLSATLGVLGKSEWKEEFKQIADGRERSQLFFERIAEPLREKTTAEWLPLFQEAGVPVAPVNDPTTQLSEPQVAHNAIYSELDTPRGRVRAPRYPMTIDGHRLTTRSYAPRLGEHDAELP